MPQAYCKNRAPRGSVPIESMGKCGLDLQAVAACHGYPVRKHNGLDEVAAAIRQRLEQGITRP